MVNIMKNSCRFKKSRDFYTYGNLETDGLLSHSTINRYFMILSKGKSRLEMDSTQIAND